MTEHELNRPLGHSGKSSVEIIVQRHHTARQQNLVAKLQVVQRFRPRVATVNVAKGKRSAEVAGCKLRRRPGDCMNEVEIGVISPHVVFEQSTIPLAGPGYVQVLKVLKEIDSVKLPVRTAQRCDGDSGEPVMDADLEHVARDAMASQQLVIGHEEQSGIVREPAVDLVECRQVQLEEACLHSISISGIVARTLLSAAPRLVSAIRSLDILHTD